MLDIYGDLDHVSIITIAPELNPDNSVIEECSKRGITVSIGHSGATLKQAESAVRSGARKVTHLFNAMTVFHHRADPGKISETYSAVQNSHDGLMVFKIIVFGNW